ncbi:nuclease [Devosia soli]|uniref:Nuclease n=1 Tax=Devosia soli TaxID=361041 RepID=A0A0F5LBJ9_9HYPH|nr:TM0106 family RecB-like putative nuclease [Devosia soli]KKB79713.1 nuclease [Devosia soli]
MRNIDGSMLFSASDLMRFMGCSHSTVLDLQHMRGAGPQPTAATEDAELLQKQGDAHEAAHLEALKASGKRVMEIKRSDLSSSTRATLDALRSGAEVIYQGAFLSGQWGGWSDFLHRVDKPSALGNFSYEVTDTKLKRRPHPTHVLQLALYSDLLSEVQGVAPEYAHVELGNGMRASLRLKDYSAYARMARGRLEAFVANPPSTRAVPSAICGLCRWSDHCNSTWKTEDSLFNVANIAKGQVKKLEAAGIVTMEGLAASEASVRGMAQATLDRLRSQARLQQARKSGDPKHQLRPPQPGKGFDLLPAPQPGDVFYDIEGDPHFEGGLEYLHGVWFDGGFRSFWAHDHAAEARSLAELLDFFRDRLARYPAAHLYHYAPYEITALRRLTAKYGIGEAFLDRLLRERRFVDLYAVVRGGLIASEPNYSIKSLEAFYGLQRDGEVKTAGGSVVAYERWRESGDQQILDEIEAYNRVDCVSTEMLRNWLVRIRPEGPWPVRAVDAADKQVLEDEEAAALRARLASSGVPEALQQRLFNLGLFHKREAKPAWWAIFDSLGREEDELIDDLDALAGLTAISDIEPIKRSVARTYEFPPQESKLREGRTATIPTSEGFASVNIEAMDRHRRTVTLKVGAARRALLAENLTLHPDPPLDTKVIAAALMDVIEDQCGPSRYQALGDLLEARAPRLSSGAGDILSGSDLVAGTIAAVHRMENTVLPVQGPPGSGKTYVTARTILSLVEAGYRVGVASNSHEAIRNVLMGCVDALKDVKLTRTLDIIHKVSSDDDGYPDNSPVRRTTDNANAAAGGNVVGGTAFFFARDENIQAFDWLFVDEAGQVGLANMAAMGRAARNIVLVGDPRQLPQVIQGSHPEPANMSCLEWLLGDHATVPADKGIFLGTTRRMHPNVCRFISEQVYEGRLQSHPDTESQCVSGTAFPGTGAFWVPVEHEGNAQTSYEEVEAIRAASESLLAGRWTDKNGATRPMQESDIIVVAPYNLQVNALRAALPAGFRVGTVDKFQGQEAPVCIVSMAASSADETSRGMEFLFSLNRINVAVSRAKGLALVFGSPRLRQAKCASIEQMRLVNSLCALESVQ